MMLVTLVTEMRGHADQLLTGHGISTMQFAALQRLRRSGPLSMRELAGELHCDASNVTGLADRLEHRGLIRRQVDPDDRRIKRLILTEEGTRVAAEVWQVAVSSSAIVALPDATKNTLRAALRPYVASPRATPTPTLPPER